MIGLVCWFFFGKTLLTAHEGSRPGQHNLASRHEPLLAWKYPCPVVMVMARSSEIRIKFIAIYWIMLVLALKKVVLNYSKK